MYSEVIKFLMQQTPGPFLGSVMLLMSEMAKGPHSPYWAYIQALPQECESVMVWSDEERAELKGGCAVVQSVTTWRFPF